jgi:hypothetical protein
MPQNTALRFRYNWPLSDSRWRSSTRQIACREADIQIGKVKGGKQGGSEHRTAPLFVRFGLQVPTGRPVALQRWCSRASLDSIRSELAEKAIELDPLQPWNYIARGFAAYRSGRLTQAEVNYRARRPRSGLRLELEFQDEPALERALNLYRRASADFADCLHAEQCGSAGRASMVTFDETAARLPSIELRISYEDAGRSVTS